MQTMHAGPAHCGGAGARKSIRTVGRLREFLAAKGPQRAVFVDARLAAVVLSAFRRRCRRAASSVTTFIGSHIPIALAVAFFMAGNLIAAGITTALANPLQQGATARG